jgi:hypothetical protein
MAGKRYALASERTGISVTLNEVVGTASQSWAGSQGSPQRDRATSLPERHLTRGEQRIFYNALISSTTLKGRGFRK